MSVEPTKKAGRPRLAKEKSRHIYAAIRLLPEENAEINAAISASSIKKSDWIRKTLLSKARGDKSFT
jgi:hypothetical protein